MNRRAKLLGFVLLAVLATVLWNWFRGPEKASFERKSVRYWFSDHLKASRTIVDPTDYGNRTPLTEKSLKALKAMGTNALPFLLECAFRTKQDSALRRTFYQALGLLPTTWHLGTYISEAEISDHAVEIICALKPPSTAVLGPLSGPLMGTNVQLHVRALKILGSTTQPSEELVRFLMRDLTNQQFSAWASAVLLEDRAKAKIALPDLISSLKDLNQPNYTIVAIVSGLGKDGGDAVPVLEQAFNATTNWIVRCRLAETLKTIDARLPSSLVEVLMHGFDSETDWGMRCRLARTIIGLDESRARPIHFLTEAWETVTNRNERMEVWRALTTLFRTNLPSWDVPLDVVNFRSPPFERWLSLGQGVQARVQGPSFDEWMSATRAGQPQYQGRALKLWLESETPVPAAADSVANLDSERAKCEEAVRAIGTNAIPWLLIWMQSTNLQDRLLSKRGLGALRQAAFPALPALVQLAQTNNPDFRSRTYACLKGLYLDWTNLWPALVPALHNSDQSVRKEAAEYLYKTFPINSQEAGLKDFVSPTVTTDSSAQ